MKRARAAATLLPKYRRMRELRRDGAHDGDAEAKRALRAFAAEWPGGLKELDTLDSDEIERRVQACEAGEDAPWMAWMARYHELMRAALAIRRGEGAGVGPSGRAGVEAGAATGGAPAVDAAFVRAVKRPTHGRINVAVFAQLGREFDVEPRVVWDTLFPSRGKVRRDYR